MAEKKTAGGVQPIDTVQNKIARKLLARGKQSEVLAKAKELVVSGDKKSVDSWVSSSQLKWQESGEFDLSAEGIPGLEGSSDAMRAILKLHGPGLVPEVISTGDGHAIVDVVSWQTAPASPKTLKSQKGTPSPEDQMGAEKMLTYRKSNDMKQSWSAEITAKADITRNARLLQQ
jgi:hypothetical protein